jgi:segregation and condensation protein A
MAHRDNSVPIDCRVSLPDFEGPLDLLLYLVKTHELDIIHLPIATITQQYLRYLNYMRELNLDLASEYLVMAATLTYIKSQVILPQEIQNEAMGPDPKAKLIRQLLELKCYKELGQMLESRPRLLRDVFICHNTGIEDIEDSIEPQVALSNSFQLLEAFRDAVKRERGVVHKVFDDSVPVSAAIKTIVERFKTEEKFSFESLLPNPHSPAHLISNFLGTLEMAKLQVLKFEQVENFGAINIERKMNTSELDNFIQISKNTLSWD